MDNITVVRHKDGSVTLMPDMGYLLKNLVTKTLHTLAVCKEEEIPNYTAIKIEE